MSNGLGLAGALSALIRRPVLLWEAVRAGIAMRARGGLLPSVAYIEWRIHTAYGVGDSETRIEDLESYLQWRRRMRDLS